MHRYRGRHVVSLDHPSSEVRRGELELFQYYQTWAEVKVRDFGIDSQNGEGIL